MLPELHAQQICLGVLCYRCCQVTVQASRERWLPSPAQDIGPQRVALGQHVECVRQGLIQQRAPPRQLRLRACRKDVAVAEGERPARAGAGLIITRDLEIMHD